MHLPFGPISSPRLHGLAGAGAFAVGAFFGAGLAGVGRRRRRAENSTVSLLLTRLPRRARRDAPAVRSHFFARLARVGRRRRRAENSTVRLLLTRLPGRAR